MASPEHAGRLDLRKKAFFEHFEKLAPRHLRYRKRYRYFWDDIVRYCNYFVHDRDRVLEVGCATGDAIGRLRGRQKTGIDFSPAMIDIARKQYPDVDFRVQDAENIALEGAFDTILLSHVTGYFDDVLQVFLSLKKVCHPRTRLIINYYNFLWEPLLLLGERIGLKRKSPRQNWLSRHQVETFLYLAGFETYRVSRRLLLPVRIPLLSFLFNRILGRLPLFEHLCINQFVFARPAPESTPEYRHRPTA
jgi:SAM-dependent methyltransferase